jgi:manganese oxidase
MVKLIQNRLALALIASLGFVSYSRVAPPPIAANDNTVPAGQLTNGVLTLHLDAREGMWHPDTDNDPGLVVQAFGESGKPLQIPGPLIRVPAGTRVRVSVSNQIGSQTLKVHGLSSRPAKGEDTLVVLAGASQSVELRLDTPGTYFYYGTTTDSAFGARGTIDSQLAGAIVVDPPGTTPRDRIFVLSDWTAKFDPFGGPAHGAMFVAAINGKSWPHTERLEYARGDTVRWRWINASPSPHPMHLHGAYYQIQSRGTLLRETPIASDEIPSVVTDRVPSGGTMTMSWTPERGGYWLFHCHVPLHVAPHMPLDSSAPRAQSAASMSHAMNDMGGLVLGIYVRGDASAPVGAGAVRKLRLALSNDTAISSGGTGYHFGLDHPDARAQAGIGIGPNPVLLIRRGEATEITVVNGLSLTTAVHWHGIELESYYDGTAGFGGTPGRIAPAIAPADSFVARFTAPRAGTFIYHTHVDELDQEPAGLAGILIVLEPGNVFDRRTDHVLLFTTPRSRRRDDYLINGVEQPSAFEWHAGETHHLRVVNMTIGFPGGLVVSVLKDTALMKWRATAKDGAVQPAKSQEIRPASIQATIGETYDFDVMLSEPGDYQLQVKGARAGRGPTRSIPIRIRSGLPK